VRFHLLDGDGEPAAVGFALEVDALLVSFRLPDASALFAHDLPTGLRHWLRSLLLRRTVALDASLPEDVNTFQRDWLYQVLLLTVACRSKDDDVSFVEAADAIAVDGDPTVFRTSLAAIVRAEVLDEDDPGNSSRLVETLHDILSRPGVVTRLGHIAAEVARIAAEDWGDWLFEVLRNTATEAVLQACLMASPANTAI
jgi:hypothetical protein